MRVCVLEHRGGDRTCPAMPQTESRPAAAALDAVLAEAYAGPSAICTYPCPPRPHRRGRNQRASGSASSNRRRERWTGAAGRGRLLGLGIQEQEAIIPILAIQSSVTPANDRSGKREKASKRCRTARPVDHVKRTASEHEPARIQKVAFGEGVRSMRCGLHFGRAAWFLNPRCAGSQAGSCMVRE